MVDLYNYENLDCIESILNWHPTRSQWWITGFNPQYEGNVDVNKQVMIGSVDFSGHQEMYESFKRQSCLKENAAKSKYLIFDNTNKTVWILWEAL